MTGSNSSPTRLGEEEGMDKTDRGSYRAGTPWRIIAVPMARAPGALVQGRCHVPLRHAKIS